jgi:hypothetical protein
VSVSMLSAFGSESPCDVAEEKDIVAQSRVYSNGTEAVRGCGCELREEVLWKE